MPAKDAGVPPCCYIVYHQLFIVKVRYRVIISATFASASEIGSVRFMPRKHTAPVSYTHLTLPTKHAV